MEEGEAGRAGAEGELSVAHARSRGLPALIFLYGRVGDGQEQLPPIHRAVCRDTVIVDFYLDFSTYPKAGPLSKGSERNLDTHPHESYIC